MEWDRQKYAADLGTLATLINKYDSDSIFINVGPALYKAQSKVHGRHGDIIEVNVDEIELILKKKMSGTIPSDLDSVSIYFEVCSDFDCSKDINVNDIIKDTYNFQIVVKGVNAEREHYNAWHLDKDIVGANASKVMHPSYHFQAGGNNLESKDIVGAIFLGAPRLPHPPMDIILGIHFILKNFCSTKDYTFLNKLFSDFDYEDIVQRARDRMFKPYFKAFSENNTHEDFTMENVFPLAIK